MYCNLNRHCIAIAHDARCKGIKKARQIYLAFEFLVLLNHECFKLLTISKRSQENWLGWYLAKSSGKLAWPRDHIEESVFKLLFISSLNTYILINFFQIIWDLCDSICIFIIFVLVILSSRLSYLNQKKGNFFHNLLWEWWW